MEENYHYRDHSGQRATGIGLAAGLGGGALIGLLALAYGLNNASKARMRAAENACAGNTKAIVLAYASEWASLCLFAANQLYDKLWQRIKNKRYRNRR